MTTTEKILLISPAIAFLTLLFYILKWRKTIKDSNVDKFEITNTHYHSTYKYIQVTILNNSINPIIINNIELLRQSVFKKCYKINSRWSKWSSGHYCSPVQVKDKEIFEINDIEFNKKYKYKIVVTSTNGIKESFYSYYDDHKYL